MALQKSEPSFSFSGYFINHDDEGKNDCRGFRKDGQKNKKKDKNEIYDLPSILLFPSNDIEIQSKKEEEPLENLFSRCQPCDRFDMDRMGSK